jgi:hypothetical protein
MPDRNGLPLQGEEVLWPDGRTETIKRYMRTRVIGYQDSAEPLEYHEEGASVPVNGHVVEMAQPRRNEFVTVITYLPSGFWQPVNIAAELSPDQRHEEQYAGTAHDAASILTGGPTLGDVRYDNTPEDRKLFRRLLTPVLVRTFVAGAMIGALVTYLFCRLGGG